MNIIGGLIVLSFVMTGCVIGGAILMLNDKYNYSEIKLWRKCPTCGNMFIDTFVRRKNG